MGWNTVVAVMMFWAVGLCSSIYFARPDRQTLVEAVQNDWQKHLAIGTAIALVLIILGLMSYDGEIDFRADRGR